MGQFLMWQSIFAKDQRLLVLGLVSNYRPRIKNLCGFPRALHHGFLALKDNTEVMYKVTNYYHPSSEKSIFWQDPDIGIKWPNTGDVILSSKDAEAMSFKSYCEMY